MHVRLTYHTVRAVISNWNIHPPENTDKRGRHSLFEIWKNGILMQSEIHFDKYTKQYTKINTEVHLL
jgi:hypothetical protein